MTAKCQACYKYWNISVTKIIPKKGYICPFCTKNIKGMTERFKTDKITRLINAGKITILVPEGLHNSVGFEKERTRKSNEL